MSLDCRNPRSIIPVSLYPQAQRVYPTAFRLSLLSALRIVPSRHFSRRSARRYGPTVDENSYCYESITRDLSLRTWIGTQSPQEVES